ncbi:cation transporter dimerization domain-containing protein [Streptomyces sp. NPDC001970]
MSRRSTAENDHDHPHGGHGHHHGVSEVRDLHVWELTSGYTALSAHILVTPTADCHTVRRAAERMLHDQYGIEHLTLQVDHASERVGADVAHCAGSHGRAHVGSARAS